jgi:ATP-binding cassette, subfamily B, bacterial
MTTTQYMWRVACWRPLHYAANVFTWTLFQVIPLVYALLLHEIFDALSGRQRVGWNVASLLTVLGLAYAARQLIFVGAFQLFSSFYLSVQGWLRRNLLRYLLMAPGSRLLPESPSEAVSRFRDDVDDINNYMENWMDCGGLVLQAIGGIAVMLMIDPLIGSVVCAPLFGMAVVMSRLSPRIRIRRRRMREATARVTDFIGEAFAATQAVKVNGAEEGVRRHLSDLGEARRAAALSDVLLTEMIRALNNGLIQVGSGLLLILAAAGMRHGDFTVGDLALYLQLLPRVTNVLTFVGDMMAQHRRMRVATERMERLLSDAHPEDIMAHVPLDFKRRESEVVAPREDAWPLLQQLRVEGLSYQYPGRDTGIRDISFTCRAGDFVVITGRIGAGKTTLLRVLQGLLPHDSGAVYWNEQRVVDATTLFRPPQSSYTAQTPKLFSETLRLNVAMGDEDRQSLEDSLELAAMQHDVAVLEKGLETMVGTRGVKLSGGQMQRASAARMLARGAQLLIMDDLSSALDVATERQLWHSLLSRQENTCLVVSHRRPALQRATKILLMSQGRLIAEGTLEELLRTQPEMQKLWDEEADEEEA